MDPLESYWSDLLEFYWSDPLESYRSDLLGSYWTEWLGSHQSDMKWLWRKDKEGSGWNKMLMWGKATSSRPKVFLRLYPWMKGCTSLLVP